jgi:hypothetical protein
MKFLLLPFLLWVVTFAVQARPVSYPGGWTMITEHSGDENNALLHYTVTPTTAIGYRVAYDRETNTTYNGAQLNYLVKRWNNPGSQANIYLKSSLGVAKDNLEGFAGLQADWEDRRFMVMYESMVMESPDNRRSKFHQEIGLGIAPYVAEFGALHTWMMFHVMQRPQEEDNWQFQPMLRFFKGTVLVEGGYNVTTHSPAANAMIRF